MIRGRLIIIPFARQPIAILLIPRHQEFLLRLPPKARNRQQQQTPSPAILLFFFFFIFLCCSFPRTAQPNEVLPHIRDPVQIASWLYKLAKLQSGFGNDKKNPLHAQILLIVFFSWRPVNKMNSSTVATGSIERYSICWFGASSLDLRVSA
jgi:hypothetical protein